MTWRALSCLLLLGPAACGSPAEPEAPAPQLYETVSTVLESPDHGPELCLSGIQQSYPPQCGGVPVASWDWAAADGVESANGTTWGGDYRLVGTYDGTTFTVTEPPAPPSAPAPSGRTRDACTTPRGDEPLATFSRIDKKAMMAAMGQASSSPDFAGLWVSGKSYSAEEGVRFDGLVLNAAFTGDLARHKAELREVWGGLLCVEQHEHTLAELRAVQEDLFAGGGAEELGLVPTWGSSSELDGVVELGFYTIPPEQQAALDERYGEGVVRVTPSLVPVD